MDDKNDVPTLSSNRPQRLDNFIKEHLKLNSLYIQDGSVYKLIRVGKILVNGLKASFSQIVTENDRVDISNVKLASLKEDLLLARSANFVPQNICALVKNSIIFEDERVIIVNKPNNISCQAGGDIEHSLDRVLIKIGYEDARIVHRLDLKTSGVMAVAKSAKVAALLSEFFRNGQVQKTYVAINYPILKKQSGTVVEKVFEKDSKTDYEVIERNEKMNVCLTRFMPLTGRKHQIRIHSRALGCPIVGDQKYGGLSVLNIAKKHCADCARDYTKNILQSKHARLYLHAQKVRIPEFGEFEAEIPNEFYDVINFGTKEAKTLLL